MAIDLDSSMESPDFTYSYSKFSCVREMYTVHVWFAYMVFASGLMAMVTRLFSSLKFLHVWCISPLHESTPPANPCSRVVGSTCRARFVVKQLADLAAMCHLFLYVS
mmetsp:Transcript_25903/g.72538  ORF Transcript_25903/g.72538 Transcript_25903/m.72538 type:complete len:107 (-) Transcript_25903:584-904(-)